MEGFSAGEGCPHLLLDFDASSNGEGEVLSVEGDDAAVISDDESAEVADSFDGVTTLIQIGGDASLTPTEAEAALAGSASRVVLIAGESESGKTTLVVELYASFLNGPCAGTSFGGSQTLRALDDRHHPARASSGGTMPVTAATRDEAMRLLHLRLHRHERIQEILLSDVRGEYFESVIDGSPVDEEVPLAARADLCLVTVDGALMKVLTERSRTLSRARQLLGGMFEAGGLSPDTPVVLVITKSDLLSGKARKWAMEQTDLLVSWATSRGINASTVIVAARPVTKVATGLEELLDAILPERPTVIEPKQSDLPGDREFWIQPEVYLDNA